MILALSLLLMAVPQVQPDASSAIAAFAVFQKNCAVCHGDTGSARGYLRLDREAMVKAGKVSPGNAEESILYKRITGVVAPLMPAGRSKLADSDIAILKRWIDEGASDWKPARTEPRRFMSNEDIIAAIEKDLVSAGSDTNRRFFRYFILTNLYNANDPKLATYRSALNKLLNSLSWDREIAIPTIVDKEQTILRIDLRDYDWSDPTGTWETILEGYPYGIEFPGSSFARIQAMTSSRIPFIRADWFLAAASMPPLYHDILELPSNEADLENCGRNARRCLNIDTQRNLQDSAGLRVVRAGITDSGVSNSNRVVERHRSSFGAYWKSHDFPDNVGEHNVFQHPLDFQRAGGEIIFNLPNGLQAYLLVNARGERLDQAPTNIVFNKGGSRAEIRNGLSCMSCHANGMRALTDDVRATLNALPEYDRQYATSLYPENSDLKKLVAEDQQRFEAAVRKTGVAPGVEPIGDLSEHYATSIDALAAASEMGMTKDDFVRRLKQSESLRQFGLATLESGGTVKRDAWEEVFGDVIQELQSASWIAPSRTYGERFFSGGAPQRLTVTSLVGRPVRTVENGWDRTYSIKDIQLSAPCSIEVRDVTRFSAPNSPLLWWVEEDTQSFSLANVRVSLGLEQTVSRLTIKANTPSIRLDRSFSSSNQWNDPSFPRSGTATESVSEVIFDLPPGPDTNRAVESLRNAIAGCAR